MDILHIVQWLAILTASLFVLAKASDHFTEAAEEAGLRMRLPSFVIGVTIVAIGTSLPELISSIIAVSKGSSEMVIGNVVGSNIANILFILGATAVLVKDLRISLEKIHIDLILLVGSALLLTVTAWDGVFTFSEGIFFMGGVLAYVWYLLHKGTRHRIRKEEIIIDESKGPAWRPIAILGVSGLFILLGAEYTVDAVISLSHLLDIGTEVIAVSAVAFGTSLPELMVSLSAIKKGKMDLVAGNILGSNIFNTLIVMGVPALIGTLVIPQSIITFSLPIMLIATFLFFLAVGERGLSRTEGAFFLVMYFFFVGKLFGFI